ncbi:MAG TPA: ABC transporter ATP-binding protein/permease [Clostridiaceae bacterium]|nr:ABC transporter ATP-binding protein/permease [Clostridiaceae bacterium]
MKEIIKKYIKAIIIISVLLLICDFLSALPPYIIKKVVDIDFGRDDIINTILFFICIYTYIHLARVIFKYIRDVFINTTICKILKDIREKLFNKILNFKMITFNKYNSSELYTRLTSDVDNLFDLFFGFLYNIVSNILYIVFMIIMMFVANINLAVIGAITICIISLIVYKFTKILGNLDNEILKKRDRENKEFSEIYNKNKLTYLFKLQNKNINKMNDLFYSELKIRKKYIFIHHFPYWIIAMIQAIGIYAIIYYALNIDVTISLGSIYLVLYYTKECKSPLEEICDQLEEMQTCINSYKRIRVLLNETDDEILENGEYIDNLNGDIEFHNVTMRYDKEVILKNLSFIIKKGTKVTIAGRTGVGKTTLTNVLMKLYDIEDGRILIGNNDISKISTKCLRDNISYISQTPYIFADTVRNNITLGNKEIIDKQIENLIHEMGVENLFNKLSDGLDTKIKLTKLSYGELQIIAFIRAILHKANIYIFDEPTSNMDLKTERMIQNIIDKISQKSTVIIIAHRKSTIESSDKIIYLKDGQIDLIINKAI